MLSEVPPHEKIRFRRCDIACLDRLPSAVVPPRPRARLRRGALAAAAGMLGLVVLMLLVAAGAVLTGFGDERLRLMAEDAMARVAGDGVTTRIGEAGVSFDGLRGLALEVGDARIESLAARRQAVSVGSVRFGLRFLPLLTGRVEIGRLRINDARIDLAALAGAARGDLLLFDEDGVLDGDAAIDAVFSAAHELTRGISSVGLDRVELSDVEILVPARGEAASLHVETAMLERARDGAVELSGRIGAHGRTATLEGKVLPGDETAAALDLTIRTEPGEAEGGPFGEATLALAGLRSNAGGAITLTGAVRDTHIPLGREGMDADIALSAVAATGSGKIEIESLRVTSGRSAWNFNGAVGVVPPGASGEEPGYRFELVSDGSTVAPLGSMEPALDVVARVAGRFGADARRFVVDEIGVRSGQGEVSGDASVTLEPGLAPGLTLNIGVAGIPVGQAKQLWPWFAATGARNWVQSNVFGGWVEEGRIELSVAPGQFGTGVLAREEAVQGRFSLRGTRFDVAGRIPPVRDADGTVEFRGTNVDIALDRGTAYSPSGRQVSASGGRLTIRDAHVKPVVGKLEIDVAGAADAVYELASYEPIAVGRFLDLMPDDFSGSVEGQAAADIPLTRGIPLDSLDWHVSLAYDDLALARPFGGQRVADATGSIVVDPGRAVIDAQASLNGAPATVHIVEPLGPDKSARERRVAMQMDDSARRAIAPGLDTLLSGTAQVELEDAAADGPRAVTVDLGRATLSLPWVGWSKGGGVPATAAFSMEAAGGRIDLSDFRLQGESFSATGALSLVDGSLQRARFPSARLNRGDDFSVDVQARGGGYAVTVRGERLDVRSAIKRHLSDSGAGSGSGAGGVPVTVDLQVAAMTGFHGETLRDVTFSYSGRGDRIDRLEMSAVTASGRPVGFTDTHEGGARSVRMRAGDAGAMLRFLDIYPHMAGGTMELALAGGGGGVLSGHIDARDFDIVNEPRLSSIVSTPPPGDGRSLNQAVRGEIDTARVHFDRGYSRVVKGPGTLALERGVVRGPLIGVSFQGTLYDADGNMALTGTFMPAYGLNRIFGEIPLIGQILGNGRDRGLIGITFRLAGKAGEPQLQINPLSVIAPGIFRSVFEFR